MLNPNRRALLAASLALAAPLALAATRGHAQAVPLRVGVLTDMAGPCADSVGSGSRLAARLAVEDAGGSVIGRPIEILSAGHRNRADIGAAIARGWYDHDHVGMIVGLDNSPVALAVEQVAREQNGIAVAIAVCTDDFTGRFCTANAMSWNYDSYALTHGVVGALMARGLDTWFFLTVDDPTGMALEGDASGAVRAAGGKILGSARHKPGTRDFRSGLIAAKASGAKAVALANCGSDMTAAVEQAVALGLRRSGRALAPLLCTITDIHRLGLPVAQGMTLMTSFTWNRTQQTRAWSRRFFKRHHTMPSMDHAATYSAVRHYIRSVAAAGTTATPAVVASMRTLPVQDFYAGGALVRSDGRLMHDMYLARVKTPAESHAPWDYEDILQTIPGDQAFRPTGEAGCPTGQF